MPSAPTKIAPRFAVAKLTSKGQITVPVEVRRALGVKSGDKLRFEAQNGGFRLVRDASENPFEKWRGIGNGPMGSGPDAVREWMHEIRGYDEYDDLLAGH